MNKRFWIACIVLLTGIVIKAQAQEDKPTYYRDSTGKLYWNRELPLYLRITPDPDEQGVLLKSEKQARYSNPYYLDNEGKNQIRTNYASHPETGERINPPVQVNWEVYADGKDPQSTARFTGAISYTTDSMRYFSKGLQVVLSATDGTSGVKSLFYQLNKQASRAYKAPLKFPKEGKYAFRHYAEDYVGNVENPQIKHFTVDLSSPQTRHIVKGIAMEKVLCASSKLKLKAKDPLSGIKQTHYRINQEEYQPFNGAPLPLNRYENGEYTLYYYSVDQVGNREATKQFTFYLDKLPPILTADILGDRFIVDDQIYFSGRSKLKLTAVDNKSGVEVVMYSVDNGDFKTYKEPFYLSSKPGLHIVKYYAVDKLGNATENLGQVNKPYYVFKHNVRNIYVDLTGPTLNHTFIGKHFIRNDSVFISPETKIQLKAQDGESGIKKITYSLDEQLEEISYEQPFTVKKDGWHSAEHFGYDKVNNRNVDEFNFFVDATAPNLSWYFSVEAMGRKEGLKKYPSYVELYVSATDKMSGAEKILYSLNDGAKQLYRSKIAGFRKQAVNTLEVSAFDAFGNSKTQTIRFYVASQKGQ